MKISSILGLSALLFLSCNLRTTSNEYISIQKDSGEIIAYINSNDSAAVIFGTENTYMKGRLKNMNREGIWEEYLKEDDQLIWKWTFKNDKKNGLFYSYGLADNIRSVGYCRNGVFEGVIVYFDPNGRPKSAELWKGLDENTTQLLYERVLN